MVCHSLQGHHCLFIFNRKNITYSGGNHAYSFSLNFAYCEQGFLGHRLYKALSRIWNDKSWISNNTLSFGWNCKKLKWLPWGQHSFALVFCFIRFNLPRDNLVLTIIMRDLFTFLSSYKFKNIMLSLINNIYNAESLLA